MPKQTIPNPENCTLSELDVAIRCTPRQQNVFRMQAIKALLLGVARPTVAELFAVSERVVFDWVRRFNEAGIDGLIDRPRSGRPPKLSPERSAEVEDLVEHPDKAGEAHWTGRKLHGYLREQLGCEIGYSTVMRWLHEAGFRLKVPQPWPDRQDEEQRAAFVAQVREWLADDEVELWYLDETGVEGDPRPRRRWIRRGEKGRVTKNGDHMRMNATGMVCPRTGEFYALEFPHADTEVFRAFLTHANQDVACVRRRNLLICDNASWHKASHLPWGQFEPVFLPPYSPDLNPIEKLWLLLKAEWFTDFVAKTQDQLIERLTAGLLWLIDRAPANQTTCTIKKEL
jgi:transposase